MCFKFKYNPSPQPMPSQPPVMARTNQTETDPLPTGKDQKPQEEVTAVEYGSSKKTGGQAAVAKTGADALRIPLNTEQPGSSGGVNV